MGTVILVRSDTALTGYTPILGFRVYQRQKCKQIKIKQFQSVVYTYLIVMNTISISAVNLAIAYHHSQSNTCVFIGLFRCSAQEVRRYLVNFAL